MARQMPSYSSLGVDVEAAPASGGLLDDSTTHTAPLRRALRSLPSLAQLLRNALPTRAELNAADAPDISVAECVPAPALRCSRARCSHGMNGGCALACASRARARGCPPTQPEA